MLFLIENEKGCRSVALNFAPRIDVPQKVRHKRVRITSWVRASLAGICSLQCFARRESAVRGLAGPSSGVWRALRCLGLGRRAR